MWPFDDFKDEENVPGGGGGGWRSIGDAIDPNTKPAALPEAAAPIAPTTPKITVEKIPDLEPKAPEVSPSLIQAHPKIAQMLMEKYPERFSDDARAKLVKELEDDANKKLSWTNAGGLIAGLGAAIAGRDPSGVQGQIYSRADSKRKAKLDEFDKGRASARQKVVEGQQDKAFANSQKEFGWKESARADEERKVAREKDPSSFESQVAQNLVRRFLGDNAPSNLSEMGADVLLRAIPSMEKAYHAATDAESKRLAAESAKRQTELGYAQLDQQKKRDADNAAYNWGRLNADEREAAIRREEAKAKSDAAAAEEKRKEDNTRMKPLREMESRKESIRTNLGKLREIIGKSGTFELFGPESAQMDSLAYQIAIDYAKLVDPSSVAREGEVAAAQKYMLPVKGLLTRNSTAVKTLDEFDKGLDDRAAAAYRAQGFEPPESNRASANAPKQEEEMVTVEIDGKRYKMPKSKLNTLPTGAKILEESAPKTFGDAHPNMK